MAANDPGVGGCPGVVGSTASCVSPSADCGHMDGSRCNWKPVLLRPHSGRSVADHRQPALWSCRAAGEIGSREIAGGFCTKLAQQPH